MQFYLHSKLEDETESAYFIDKSPPLFKRIMKMSPDWLMVVQIGN